MGLTMQMGDTEVDVDGHIDEKGIRYIGKALKQPDGTWICLADIGNSLCRVEVKITPTAPTAWWHILEGTL